MHTKGITFGNYHSYRDFGLILSSKVIGAPSPKTELIDIPGGDGVLDLTEFFGEVKYNNRTLTFEFSTIVPQSEFMTLFSRVQNALHGQKMQITLDEDPEWYYIGRLSVSEWKAEKRIGKLTVECDCEPFKYRLTSKTVDLGTEQEATVTFHNTRKPAIPTMYVHGDVTVESPSTFITLSEGKQILPEFVFHKGENALTFKGNGVVVVEWKEGGL